MARSDLSPDPGVDGRVRREIQFFGIDSFVDDFSKTAVLAQIDDDADGLAEAIPIEGIGEVVDDRLAVGFGLDADGAPAVEQDSMDEAVSDDCEVRALPSRLEVTDGSAPSNPVCIVECYRPDACGVGMIVIWAVWVAGGPAGLVECAMVGFSSRPLNRRMRIGPSFPW